MTQLDTYEAEVLVAFDQGALKSVATQAELAKFRAAARSTAVKDKRVKSGIVLKETVSVHKRPSAK